MCWLLCYTIVWSNECNSIIVLLTFCIVVLSVYCSDIHWPVKSSGEYLKLYPTLQRKKRCCICVRACVCVYVYV